jgi:hypothetical protein
MLRVESTLVVLSYFFLLFFVRVLMTFTGGDLECKRYLSLINGKEYNRQNQADSEQVVTYNTLSSFRGRIKHASPMNSSVFVPSSEDATSSSNSSLDVRLLSNQARQSDKFFFGFRSFVWESDVVIGLLVDVRRSNQTRQADEFFGVGSFVWERDIFVGLLIDVRRLSNQTGQPDEFLGVHIFVFGLLVQVHYLLTFISGFLLHVRGLIFLANNRSSLPFTLSTVDWPFYDTFPAEIFGMPPFAVLRGVFLFRVKLH